MLRLHCLHRQREGAQAVAVLWKISASETRAAVPNLNSLVLHAEGGRRHCKQLSIVFRSAIHSDKGLEFAATQQSG